MLVCYIHANDIDRLCYCHDYSAHLDMYIILVSYLIHLGMIDSLGVYYLDYHGTCYPC